MRASRSCGRPSPQRIAQIVARPAANHARRGHDPHPSKRGLEVRGMVAALREIHPVDGGLMDRLAVRRVPAQRPGFRAQQPEAQRQRVLQPGVEARGVRSEEHTSELQSPYDLVCRLLLEKKKKTNDKYTDK